jgi:hypothetical protein
MKATLLLLFVTLACANAEMRPVNYDESKVPQYTLPDPLARVADAAAWRAKRRPEILKLFQSQMYGHSPPCPADVKCEVTSVDKNALGGQAIRKEITMRLFSRPVRLLVYLPANAAKPVPVFVSANFRGNHTVNSDPGITITEQWTRNNKTKTEALTKPDETTRGRSVRRWPLDKILARGYALAVIPYADIEPDYPDGWKHGIRGTWLKQSGKAEFASDDWGAIGAWAWGLSRALDYLETDKAIDAKRAIVVGHSRLGKTALWAGAQDERFAITISNDSGEGGAALARRRFGETTAVINETFPHWFCASFKQYGDREESLPFDQHELIALIAPRPVYIASAEEDRWADPRGEFLAAKGAEPVFRLLGKSGLDVDEMPAANHPVGASIGYHVRTGKHDIMQYDWEQFLSFADKHLKKNP